MNFDNYKTLANCCVSGEHGEQFKNGPTLPASGLLLDFEETSTRHYLQTHQKMFSFIIKV